VNVEFLVSQSLYWFVWCRILYTHTHTQFFFAILLRRPRNSRKIPSHMVSIVYLYIIICSVFIRWFMNTRRKLILLESRWDDYKPCLYVYQVIIPMHRWARPKYLPVEEHSAMMYVGNTAVFAYVVDWFIRRSCENLFLVL
jgi:hypothetical protein